MLRLQGLGTYIDDQVISIVRRGKQRGHIPGVGRLLTGRGKDVLVSPEPQCTHTADVDELKRTNKQLNKQMDMIMKVLRSDDNMSSAAYAASVTISFRCYMLKMKVLHGDDEPGDDEDADEEEDEDS
nr:hypothetical protein [Tanacetum cinerariifolium]